MPDNEPDLLPEELDYLLHDEVLDSEVLDSEVLDSGVLDSEVLDSGVLHDEVLVNEASHLECKEDHYIIPSNVGAESLRAADPSCLPPAAIAAVSEFTRDFSERLASALTERLQAGVSAEVIATNQSTFADFLSQSQQPTCFEVIHSGGLQAPLFWEWSPQLLFPLLDRLLGGGQLPPTIARRPLTEIEKRLAWNVSEHWLELLAATWSPALELTARLDRIEANPQANLSIESDTPIWIAELLVDLGSHQGSLRIAYLQDSLCRVADRLIEAQRKPRTHSSVSVVIAESHLSQNELLDLRVGDILTTDAGAADPAAIYVDEKLLHHGVPGAQGGKKAIRIA